MVTRRGAWIRYQDPLSDEQLDFAVEHYQAAILQPWETEAAGRLKERRPDMTVLAYKCLSSVRDFEEGPVFTSGVSLEEAEEAGEEWFAHREDGSRIQWSTYPGHWQMAVWDPEYRERWCDNVTDFLEGTPWDGVMADNDVFDDYYRSEEGPVFTSDVSLEEAEEAGEEWFAHREDGSRIQWSTYPGHWQMAVWDPEYRERWCDNVTDFLEGTPWDGVMADNDVFDDYY